MCMALSPIGILSSFLAITDGGMILFWIGACAYLVGKIDQKITPNYIIIGFLIMCGALFKWPIYSLWFLILGSWIFFPQLRSWRIVIGFMISMLALVPSLYWNSVHEWATFKHVFATVSGGNSRPKGGNWFLGNPLEFFGAQAVLVSPILFILMLMAFWGLIKQRRVMNAGLLFCGGISLTILIVALVASCFMKLQGNWAIFAYPSAFVLLGWYASEWQLRCKKWLVGGLILSVFASCIIFSIPLPLNHKPKKEA